MKRLIVVVFVVGCASPHEKSVLLEARNGDPELVSDVELGERVRDAQSRLALAHSGIVFQLWRSDPALDVPDRYGSGGDSCLFTGVLAASHAWRYRSGEPDALQDLAVSVDALYTLTHVTGLEGVVARCALRLDNAEAFSWPWRHREPFTGERNGWGWYTRTTRDQLSGLVLGLAATVNALQGDPDPRAVEILNRAREIARHVEQRLRIDDWEIKNEHGENATSADTVTGLIRFGLIAVNHPTESVKRDIEKYFKSARERLVNVTNRYNSFDGYFAHNLRVMRCLAIRELSNTLDPSGALVRKLVDYARASWWRYVSQHRNAWFAAAWQRISGEDVSDSITRDLKSWSARPTRSTPSPLAPDTRAPGICSTTINDTSRFVIEPQLRKPTGYFTWQKEPWDVGDLVDLEGAGEDCGLSLYAPYWLARAPRNR